MRNMEGSTELDRSVAAVPRLSKHGVIAAAILLISGCSHPPGNTAPRSSRHRLLPRLHAHPARYDCSPRDPRCGLRRNFAGLGYYRGPIDGSMAPRLVRLLRTTRPMRAFPTARCRASLLQGWQARCRHPWRILPMRPALSGPSMNRRCLHLHRWPRRDRCCHDRPSRGVAGRRGAALVGRSDFTLPAGRPGAGAIVALNQALSWPLRVGSTATYTVKSGLADDPAAGDYWRCAVESRESIAVAAGTFDTYKIACRLDGEPSRQRSRGLGTTRRPSVTMSATSTTPPSHRTTSRERDPGTLSPYLRRQRLAVEARTGLEWPCSTPSIWTGGRYRGRAAP
jgi:hypothetical protein